MKKNARKADSEKSQFLPKETLEKRHGLPKETLEKRHGYSKRKNNDISERIKPPIEKLPYFDRLPVDTIGSNWPNQSLFHGMILGVEWNSSNSVTTKNVEIDAAIGINQEEALGALISGELAEINSTPESERHALEEFLVGFSYNLLGELDQPDGDYRFRNAVHRESFDAISSGIIYDYVIDNQKSDGPFSMDPSSVKYDMMSKSMIDKSKSEFKKMASPFNAEMEYGTNVDSGMIPNFPSHTQGGFSLPDAPSPLDPKVTSYPAPRYYEAKDPVLLIANARRSTRHGGDRMYNNGKLRCRSSQTPLCVTGPFRSVCFPSTYRSPTDYHGSVPRECNMLIWEMERYSSDILNPQFKSDFENYLSGQPSIFDSSDFAISPVGVNIWSQAWVPIIMDCQMTYYPDPEHWEFGEIGFNRSSDAPPYTSFSGTPITFEKRIPLTRGPGQIVEDQITRFLLEEEQLDGDAELGVIDVELEEQLSALKDVFRNRDLLSATLAGIDESIDQFHEDNAIRAGVLKINRLVIIDAFGQSVELDTEGIMSGVRVGLSLENQTDDNNLVLIKPRIPRGARLNLRLLTHDDDESEANAGSSRMAIDPSTGVMPPARTPVCAYLLPDHIEWAMEVFDHEGDALGQLKVADRNWAHSGIQKGKLAWDPSPGRETPLGALPEISNQHASNLINSLIEIGLVDDLERGKWDDNNAAGNTGGEGVLSAILRAIDTTSWHSDPYGTGGMDHPAFYMGRPVAVVRAKLRLEVEEASGPLSEELANHLFQVRLGAVQSQLDGLLGYFVNDDYSRFHAVYPLDSGSPIVPYSTQDEDYPEGLDHPFLVFDPTVDVRPEVDVYLTLLMNPQSSVHVTSGFLPQKEITLLREHWEDAVSRIAPSFRVGPVLVDPSSVRMPIDGAKPNLIWSWTHRESPSEWVETPVKRSDSLAGLPNGKMTAYEGWIKLDIDESQDSGN